MTTDLLASTAELVDIASESFDESAMGDHVEAALAGAAGLAVTRVGDNVVARTDLGRSLRLILAGHTDTVPANDNAVARIEGDTLWGVGSADMKGGLAVMLALAHAVQEPAVDISYVFYAREEVAAEHSGLAELARSRPDLLVGDVAILGEPSSAAIEAGCQGTMRVRVTFRGDRAHTARPWMGRNAIHRVAGLLGALDGYQERRPLLQGCAFREAMQAVYIEGGVAGNVVPDEVRVTVNHRFAPDRSPAEAEAHVRELVEPWLDEGDGFEVTDRAPGAMPALEHPVVASLVRRNGLEVSAKLGWTDVSFFAERGVPAVNFGPGDATVAHTQAEHLERDDLTRVHDALRDLLTQGI